MLKLSKSKTLLVAAVSSFAVGGALASEKTDFCRSWRTFTNYLTTKNANTLGAAFDAAHEPGYYSKWQVMVTSVMNGPCEGLKDARLTAKLGTPSENWSAFCGAAADVTYQLEASRALKDLLHRKMPGGAGMGTRQKPGYEAVHTGLKRTLSACVGGRGK